LTNINYYGNMTLLSKLHGSAGRPKLCGYHRIVVLVVYLDRNL